jgi:hypothetical protein
MATTEIPTTGIPTFDAALEHVTESSEQFLVAARKAGNLYLDFCEKAVDRDAELQLNLVGLTQQEWLKSLIEAQVDVTKELAGSYTTTARSFVK